MPMLLAAEKNGVFNTPPKHPEYARKAMRNSDEPSLAPLAEGESPIGPSLEAQAPMPDYRSMDLAQLAEACREKGLDTQRTGKDYMIKQLEASHGAGAVAA